MGFKALKVIQVRLDLTGMTALKAHKAIRVLLAMLVPLARWEPQELPVLATDIEQLLLQN
jgi:hypothetical protein